MGWQLEWSPDVKAWFKTSRNVNVLEYAGIVLACIITAAACEAAAFLIPVLQWCDNTSAVSWGQTACTPTAAAAALAVIHGFWITSSKIHTRAAYIEGPKNDVGDYLSRNDVSNDFGVRDDERAHPPTAWAFTRDTSNTTNYDTSTPLPQPWRTQVNTLVKIPQELASMIFTAVSCGRSPPPEQLTLVKQRLTTEFLSAGLTKFTGTR